MKTEFRRDARKFIDNFVIFAWSIIVANSVVGRGFTCFCPAILISGVERAPLQLFGMISEGLLEKSWVKDT